MATNALSHRPLAFEEIEHTADWALRVYGRTLRELLVNAAVGMNTLLTGNVAAIPRRVKRRFVIYGDDMAKVETHQVNGQPRKLCVHRKGATRAFGPGSPVLPDDYRDLGQPVLAPGSMGTANWVLLGTAGSMAQTFGSTCHGAGRAMSRTQAKKSVQGSELRLALEAQGIHVRAGSLAGLAEEAPVAYKDVDRVIAIVHGAGIAKKVARLRPVAVIKG